MVFLLPLFVVFAIIFGINYIYFDDVKPTQKIEKKQISQKEINDYIKEITK